MNSKEKEVQLRLPSLYIPSAKTVYLIARDQRYDLPQGQTYVPAGREKGSTERKDRANRDKEDAIPNTAIEKKAKS